MTEIITRKDAKLRGLKHYFTGTPCKHGHISERTVNDCCCTICSAEKSKMWRLSNPEKNRAITKKAYDKNSERILKRNRDRRASDPEKAREYDRAWKKAHREKICKSRRAKRLANIEQARANERARRAVNPELARSRHRRWKENNPGAMKAHAMNRRARKQSSEGFHSAADISRIRRAQRDNCACCRVKLNGGGHVDHIIPLSRGGSNWANNLQLLCEKCNLSKHKRDPIEFMQSRGRLL